MPQQPIDRPFDIELFAGPAADGGTRRDPDRLTCHQVFPACGQRLRTVETLTVRFGEPECAVIEAGDRDSSFVHLAVVEPAERHEVPEFGLATLRPVLDVMPIHVAGESTAWEAAAAVA